MADDSSAAAHIELGIPKGRMKDGVISLLNEAGVALKVSDRGYRPTISLPNYSVKLLKPQNILEMIESGTRDIGFGGLDWVKNLGLKNVVEVLDTGLDPVRLVVAAPDPEVIANAKKSGKQLRVASEYEGVTRDWIAANDLNARFVRAFGATESFPPEDADIILDNTATGATLAANGLHIIDTVLRSSTRLYASRQAYDDAGKRAEIDKFALLLKSALEGRLRKMLEFNVSEDKFNDVVKMVPSMRAPTVSKLHDGMGYAVKVVMLKSDIASLLPRLKDAGATDIVIYDIHLVIA